jgi:hypothetical protein
LAQTDEWWGYSSIHGWVVLDRKLSQQYLPAGLQEREWLFFKCEDSTYFKVKDQHWRPPEYVAERSYIASLTKEVRENAAEKLGIVKKNAFGFANLYVQQHLASEKAKVEEAKANAARWAEEARINEARSAEEAKINAAKWAETARINAIRWAEGAVARDAARQAQVVAELLKKRETYFSRLGLVDPGTREGGGKFKRVTKCYSCGKPLDNSVELECVACNWILCKCGACGCGYVKR